MPVEPAAPDITTESATPETIRALADAWATTAAAPDESPCWRARMLLDVDSGACSVLFRIHHALFDGRP